MLQEKKSDALVGGARGGREEKTDCRLTQAEARTWDRKERTNKTNRKENRQAKRGGQKLVPAKSIAGDFGT